MKLSKLWAELKRRRVTRVLIGYVAAWAVITQTADPIIPALGLPEWTMTLLVVLGLLGLPVAVALAWAFDLTPDGIERATEKIRPAGALGRWVVVGLVGVAVAIGAWRFTARIAAPPVTELDADLIVVSPFRVASAAPDVQALGEGMLDLLAPLLSDAPRMVDPGGTVAAWRELVSSEDQDLTEEEAVELGRRLGAGRVLVGSVVGSQSLLSVTGRLLRVPDGAAVGEVTAEGPGDRPWSVAGQIAGQIMSLEANEEPARLDYLTDVPTDAVREYMLGQRFYRRGNFPVARQHFVRALDIDSTFALAALGGRRASDIGFYPGKGELESRFHRVLDAHLDRLPPADRALAEFLRRMPGLTVGESVAGAASLAQAYPDKPDGWYWLGQRLFHGARMVADTDYLERAEAAMERAHALDPGNGVVESYLALVSAMRGDTAQFLAKASAVVGPRGADSDFFLRSIMAYEFGDTLEQRWFRESLDTLAFSKVLSMPMGGFGIPADIEDSDMGRWLDALWAAAVTPQERFMAVSTRYRAFRSLGRTAEAEAEQRRRADLANLPALGWLADPLYWEGEEEEGAAWVGRLREEFADPSAPIQPFQRIVVCLWQVWEIRQGNTSRVEWAMRRLRDDARDPDPRRSLGGLCGMLLETMLAHERDSATADSLVAELAGIAGEGIGGYLGDWINLELARILEGRGDLIGAARTAWRPSGFYPAWPPHFSTMVHEGARLYDAAGEVDEALALYRWYLLLRKRPDPHLQPEADRIRARVEELERLSEGE